MTTRQVLAMLACNAIVILLFSVGFFGLCHALDGSCRIVWPSTDRALARLP
jgi:hypothetical protein